MKFQMMLMTTLAVFLMLTASCGADDTSNEFKMIELPAEKTKVADASTTAAAPAATGGWSGKVLETMNSGGYTYVNVDLGNDDKMWAAGPQSAVEVGDTVHIPEGMLMSNFESKTLGRTFEQIYFVPAIHTGDGPMPAADFPKNMMGQMPEGHPDLSGMMPEGHPELPQAQQQMPEGHPDISTMMAASHDGQKKSDQADTAPPMDFTGLEKAEGGHTVAEIFAKKDELVDKSVTLRGKVVKYNEGILGKNWIHLRDGSGEEGKNDLTVTTSEKAAVGDVVLVKGTLRANLDFGFGYKYDLLIENAAVTVEKK